MKVSCVFIGGDPQCCLATALQSCVSDAAHAGLGRPNFAPLSKSEPGRKKIHSSVAATKGEWMEERLVCLHAISMTSNLGRQ